MEIQKDDRRQGQYMEQKITDFCYTFTGLVIDIQEALRERCWHHSKDTGRWA